MKKIIYLFALPVVSLLFFSGCSKFSSNSDEQSYEDSYDQTSDISKILYLFDNYNISTAEEGSALMNKICGDVLPVTKGTLNDSYENISPDAAIVISNFQNVTVGVNDTEQSVKERFYAILDESSLDKDSDEYTKLKYAIDTSFELFTYLSENQIVTKSFWDVVADIARCVGGTVGSAGLGALAGVGVGTITLPVVGTVSGTAVGGVCGALVGAATFC